MKAFNPRWLLLTLTGIAVVILLALFVSGFFKSEEAVIQEAKQAAESSLHENDLPLNTELEHVSMYLPDSMEVLSDSPNNILLESDEKKYILFYNPYEKKTSQTFYKSAKEDENVLKVEAFEHKEVFGYMKVAAIEEDTYELQVGAGGVKMTTETDLSNMEDDAQKMMKVVHSIVLSTSN
ncbi:MULTISPECIES: hypothetical protein [Pontibacillus]|uniref:DUF4367 domain-containing protein n=1 Tax=Pontibacillus chungwhensis TaxID=265426 RepID=A0ABY8UWZ9_9BACI|nr:MULTISPECIES: hypothetical protein [Pontibacillus]MCD5323904.1 hypothetical protein [Pontibacillus sp. HN14]WIF97261.1 hypothetical protein QNI29_16170 [Pontibacillus chungwhensis]